MLENLEYRIILLLCHPVWDRLPGFSTYIIPYAVLFLWESSPVTLSYLIGFFLIDELLTALTPVMGIVSASMVLGLVWLVVDQFCAVHDLRNQVLDFQHERFEQGGAEFEE